MMELWPTADRNPRMLFVTSEALTKDPSQIMEFVIVELAIFGAGK